MISGISKMIIKRCSVCKNNKVKLAYWDKELECYIYLNDIFICKKCNIKESSTQSIKGGVDDELCPNQRQLS